ncbi:MAG: molybdopterin-synthase adenylyltransferase MoeB [Arenicellaceae bacterium]|nr:molybdopterin-synthase adenylyltransferase MoeB [Arenicellaceae bacterium]
MQDEQLLRYSRQIFLPEIDVVGQQVLLSSRVLILGLGGLGSPAAMYLASGGVGTLALADFDDVDLSNLQRQVVHGTSDVGSPKTASAAKRLTEMNPDIELIELSEKLNEKTLQAQVELANVVLDCTDNFSSRFLINKVCFQQRTPLVNGSAVGFGGQLAVFDFSNASTPCYQCLYPVEGPDGDHCSDTGVIGPLVGVIGSLQALESLKIILSIGQTLAAKLLLFDAFESRWHSVSIPADPDCSICS